MGRETVKKCSLFYHYKFHAVCLIWNFFLKHYWNLEAESVKSLFSHCPPLLQHYHEHKHKNNFPGTDFIV